MTTLKNKVLLAFSGGLDTTFCAIWLQEKGYDVHAATINTGGFSSEELAEIETRVRSLNISSFTIIDGTKRFYDSCIKYLVFGNVLKNGTYPLSVSAERVTQAMLLAEYAGLTGISTIAHGSTGAGNDQVRFDMLLDILVPDVKIITPIRDLKLSRQEEIDFLKNHGVKMNFEKAAYSINKGIWGTSVGGKETLTSHLPLPESAFPTRVTANIAQQIILGFENGELKTVNLPDRQAGRKQFEHPSDAIIELNKLAAPFGIGRDIHVGDTIIGIKGRVGFEAPAPYLIIKAHQLLEKHVLTKWQLYWKDQVAQWYGNWMHEGQFFEPAMRNMEAMMSDMQKNVTGEVFITLHPYRFTLDGISSPFDLMQAQEGQYGEMNNGWTGEDVKGFTKIFGNQVKSWYKLQQKSPEVAS